MTALVMSCDHTCRGELGACLLIRTDDFNLKLLAVVRFVAVHNEEAVPILCGRCDRGAQICMCICISY